jgi:hypothetical protein
MSSSPDVSPPVSGPPPTPDAPAESGADAPFGRRRTPERNPLPDPEFEVREADLEPYIGLRYLSRLFRLIASILVILLVAEVITGFVSSGFDAFPTLVDEVSRLIVLAGVLWGSGDLAILLIDMGHDLRATRILLGRQLAHHTAEQHVTIDPGVHSR